MHTTTSTSERPSLLLRWWRNQIVYPVASERFRPTSQFDMLRSLRTVARLLTICTVAMVAILAFALSGHALPMWTTNFLGLAGVGIMFATTPPARYAAFGLALSSARKNWSEAWFEAEVPMTRLWTMLWSPVSVNEFTEYATVLKDDPSARLDGGVDPRIVWAMVERGMTVRMVSDYMAAGVSAENAIALRESGIDPGEWLLVLQAGIVPTSGDEKKNDLLFLEGLRYVNWVRRSRASLHPTQFEAAIYSDPPRPVRDTLPMMEAWLTTTRAPSVRLNLSERAVCVHWTPPPVLFQPLPCKRCGGTEASGHQKWFVNTQVGPRGTQKYAVAEWTEYTGLLAPYFIAAGIGLTEARVMVDSDACPSVEDLVFMAAWKD